MTQKKDISPASDVSIISSGAKIEGKFFSDGNVRVDGKIIGEVNVKGNLTLGESCEIKGDINAMNVTVSGNIQGTVTAKDKIVLDLKSSLKGDLFAKVLMIEEGATFDGRSTMSQSPEELPPKKDERES
jgi:cytoskeletal protein CcmA (bactofilin family)